MGVLLSISSMKNFFVLALLSSVVSFPAIAGTTPSLSNLSQAESDSIAKTFANAVAFRSLEPPSSNGKIWGFGIGLAFDATSAKDLNDTLTANGNTQNISALPAGDLVITLQGPLGIAVETGFLPRMKIGGLSTKRTAFNAKWTFTDVFLRGRTPFDAAIRLGYGRNEFQYDQMMGAVLDTVRFDSKALRAELAMSRKLLVFEPYLGLGLLRTSNTLSNTAATTLFNFTASDRYDYSKSSFLFNIGTEVRLIFLTMGAQVEWAFGETTGSLKLGFKF